MMGGVKIDAFSSMADSISAKATPYTLSISCLT